jgi:hypothetical protein
MYYDIYMKMSLRGTVLVEKAMSSKSPESKGGNREERGHEEACLGGLTQTTTTVTKLAKFQRQGPLYSRPILSSLVIYCIQILKETALFTNIEIHRVPAEHGSVSASVGTSSVVGNQILSTPVEVHCTRY